MNQTNEHPGITTVAATTVHITINNTQGAFPKGVLLKEAIEHLLPNSSPQILCALSGGLCLELNQPIEADCNLTLITYQDEEGRRMY